MSSDFARQFVQLYDHGCWFGDTFKEKLKDVTEEQAFRQPIPGVHSIAELVSHCIYWRTPLIYRLQGDTKYKATIDDEKNWIPLKKLKEKGWKKLQNEFDESQAVILDLLAKANDKVFSEDFSPGKSMAYITEGIIQHDIYHLGQLALVKKMITM